MEISPIRIDIPPTNNTETGYSCGEVAVMSMLRYLLPEAAPLSRNKAEELTGKIPHYNTWPEQLVRISDEYPELDATIYRSHPITIPVDAYIRTQYGTHSAEVLIAETDLPDLEAAIIHSEKVDRYIISPFDMKFLLQNVIEGQVVIPWIDYDVLHERNTGIFNAHYIIVTGYDKDNVTIHECGGITSLPVAHQKISTSRFFKELGPDPDFIVFKKS